MRGELMARRVLLAGLAAALLVGGQPAWSKGGRGKDDSPALWIAADRVVGFVPFTVSLYGKVLGSVEPGRLELCREAAMQADISGSRQVGDDPMSLREDRAPSMAAGSQEPACSTGTLVRTQEGYAYSHEMRFDRPGTYRVRLHMVDGGGHRVISNTVQVNAL